MTYEDRADRRTGVEQGDVLLVTGLSGAGMSTTLHILEDLGYEAIDNLPFDMIRPLAGERASEAEASALAVGLGVRTRHFDPKQLAPAVETWRREGLEVQIIFLDCDSDGIKRRFSETRRRHPLGRQLPLAEAIQRERDRLAPLAQIADLVVDTSHFRPNDLREKLVRHFAGSSGDQPAIFAKSFGFRYGLPADADLVFDVRFLRNPHYEPTLRSLTGLSEEVQAFVRADNDYGAFFSRLRALLEPLLPRYRKEGKSYLTIALGCTGGKHRSVVVAEALGHWVRELGYDIAVTHRELDRDSYVS